MSTLHADTPAPAPAPAAPAAPVDPASPEAKQKAAAALSAAEMQTQAQVIMTRLPEDYKYILYLREQAKKSKDIIKLTCVNDKLVEVKAQLNLADSANADLQAAISNNSGPEGRATFFVNLQTSSDAVSQLRRDAEVCAGTPDLYKQESGVTVDHPDLPDPGAGDPFDTEGGVGDLDPPGYASPFN